MTIDKEQLKALAEASQEWSEEIGESAWYVAGNFEKPFFGGPDAQFIAAANPATILALLDEIEHLTESRQEARDLRNKMGDRLDAAEAELAELRKDAARLTWLDESQEVDLVGPTLCCGKHRPTLREAIDAAMAMEARHGC